MALNFSIILEVIVFYIIDKIINGSQPIVHKDPIAYPNDYTSVWPFMPKIGFAFEY